MACTLRTLSILLLMTLIVSCESGKPTDPQGGNRSKPPSGNKTDHVFELKFGQTTTIESENVTVTFESVKQDSRCPSDVVCFWEGQAIIGLRVIAIPADTHVVDLTLYGGCAYGCSPYAPSLDTLGYRFRLLALDPYPVSTVDISADDYVATMAVFPFQPIDSADGEVLFSNDHPVAIQGVSYDIDSVWIDGDVLSMMVAYGCGCVEPELELYMSPSGFFYESLPFQANLYLRHTDVCEMGCHQAWSFDVRPVAQLYEIKYGQIDCIALNVYDFIRSPDSITRTTVIYHPDGATSTPWCEQ